MSDTIDDGTATAGKCPVDLQTRSLWGLWGGGGGVQKRPSLGPPGSAARPAASLEEAARHAQTPQPGQRLALSTHRLESTIPRSGTTQRGGGNGNNNNNLPAHQIRADDNNSDENSSSNNNNNNRWVYPSEQQVFNAMKRKGWKNVEEESIPSFLQIHNSVNERSWREVLRWEDADNDHHHNASEVVELSRFEGRPRDLTPKAWFLSAFGIRDKPFDRHDWYVIRNKTDKTAGGGSSSNGNGNGNDDPPPEKRYVLDFYMTNDVNDPRTGGMPRVEIDVRPALDSPEAFLQRGKGLLREVFPGIAREYDAYVRPR